MKNIIGNNNLNHFYLSKGVFLVLSLIILCLCSCNGESTNSIVSNKPATTVAGNGNPISEPTPHVTSNRNFKKVTVNSKESRIESEIEKLLQDAMKKSEKGYLAYEIETEGIIDNSLLAMLKDLGQPMSGRYYDTFICYHIPFTDIDLEELKTLYNHSSVKEIRILSSSSYDYIKNLYISTYTRPVNGGLSGLVLYDDIEKAIQGLIEYSQEEMDYLIFDIKINGHLDGVLLNALRSFENNEKFEQSDKDAFCYKVRFEDVDLTVLKTLYEHPSVNRIIITGKEVDFPDMDEYILDMK